MTWSRDFFIYLSAYNLNNTCKSVSIKIKLITFLRMDKLHRSENNQMMKYEY